MDDKGNNLDAETCADASDSLDHIAVVFRRRRDVLIILTLKVCDNSLVNTRNWLQQGVFESYYYYDYKSKN